MSVSIIRNHDAGEERAAGEMMREGFETATKDYAPGTTEPHRHDYDVCLFVLEGEFRLVESETGTVHILQPGDKAAVERGTLHSEEHGALRMVVGRRH